MMLSLLAVSAPLLIQSPSATTTPTPPPEVYEIRSGLGIEPLGKRRRSPIYTAGLEHARALGLLPTPKEGSVLEHADGTPKTWRAVEADDDGGFRDLSLRGGWIYASLNLSDSEAGSFVLEAQGHSFVYVNGYPRAGDVYGLGTTHLPMTLPAGTHDFYFRVGRPPVKAKLVRVAQPIRLERVDLTLPDVIRGETGRLWMGQLISNAGERSVEGWSVMASAVPTGTAEVPTPLRTPVPLLLAGSQRKHAIAVPAPIDASGDTYEIRIQLRDETDNTVIEDNHTLRIRSPWEKHNRTFLSRIDGSVQYFSVCPPPQAPDTDDPLALVLSLHGASVEAHRQTGAYQPKDWAYIVAPTNRRPYGFDWEDWGRWDALEVLDIASNLFQTDPDRTYLTGHSMGGHGTWQVGAHASNRFAAIAPSAGWQDFWSYGGGAQIDAEDPIGALLSRALQPSRTLLLQDNYHQVGVSILHGDADDVVPIREARAMRDLMVDLGHKNFAYFERVGGGHWWGDECVDWPPIFDYFQHQRRPQWESALQLEFVTASPAIRAEHGWLRVERAHRNLDPLRLKAQLQPGEGILQLEGDNIARCSVDLSGFLVAQAGAEAPVWPAEQDLTVAWSDSRLTVPYAELAAPIALGTDRAQTLVRRPDTLPAGFKTPERMGPFKAGWDHRMVFVYGSIGAPDENAWSFAKARFDHETWRYRGNGSVTLVRDVDFDPRQYPDRSIVLYGNQDTHAAWNSLLPQTPITLKRGEVGIGEDRRQGEDLALLAIYPRADSEVASVVIVGGTGLVGQRLTDTMPYFVSGVAYPDWTVFDASFLKEGLPGIVGAGCFGADWSLEAGAESHWRTR